MDNKQNQPNSGQPSSSANANNKTAAQQPQTPSSSASAKPTAGTDSSDASRQSQPQSSASSSASPKAGAASASTAETSRTATGSSADSASTTASSTNSETSRKSWLDQDQWAKSLNELPQSLKDLGTKALDQVNSLSPTQKVVGGALLVSGLSWLALRGKSNKSSSVASNSPYASKSDSKWKPSSQSVYRGSTSGQRNTDLEDDSF